MAYHYFIRRPEVSRFLQWDGSNLEEVVAHAQQTLGEGSDFVDNGDGTWSYQLPDGTLWGTTYEVGDWVDTGAQPSKNSDLLSKYQQVNDATELSYEVSGS